MSEDETPPPHNSDTPPVPVTRQKTPTRSTTQIKNVLSSDQTKYQTRGFKITDIHSDNEFNIKFLQPTILQI